ncbi:MAG: hypothetical protein U0361_07300 [Nitrospiraceae bacterium]
MALPHDLADRHWASSSPGCLLPWLVMADADVLVAEAILSYEHKRYDEAIAL